MKKISQNAVDRYYDQFNPAEMEEPRCEECGSTNVSWNGVFEEYICWDCHDREVAEHETEELKTEDDEEYVQELEPCDVYHARMDY